MANEVGELEFVARMRDEATREAAQVRAGLNSLGGTTSDITVPVKAKAETKRARAQIKALEKSLKDTRVDLDVTTVQARKRLAELTAAIKATKARIGVDLDAAEAAAQIKALTAERDSIKVALDLNTTSAQARIVAIKAQIRSLRDETIDLDVKGGNTLTEASRGVSSLLTAIVVLGPTAAPIIAALTVALGGLAGSAIAAAGTAGLVGLAVAGQVKPMTDAQKEITKTRDKLATLDKGSKEYAETAAQLRKQQRTFTREFGPAASGLEVFRKSWARFKDDTRDSSVQLIGEALRGAASVLKMLTPLANAGTRAVTGLVREFRTWSQGPEMREIRLFFEAEGPRAVTSWGHIVGNVVAGILQLFMAFGPEISSMTGGLERITAEFHDWAGALDESQGFQEFLAYARMQLPVVGRFIGQLVLAVVRLATAFAPFGGAILSGITGILSAINALPIPVIQALGAAIAVVVIALKAWQLGVLAVTTAQRLATVATLSYTASMKGFNLATATGAGKLGTAAAGIAGVTVAAKSGGGALGVLGSAASGALAGGALGSFLPGAGTTVGAIVGGLVGLTTGLLGAGDAAEKSGEGARAGLGSWQAYAATLDQVTGATTRATRVEALHQLTQAKVLPKLAEYGITARQAVDAVVKGGKARADLVSKLNAEGTAYGQNITKAKAYLTEVQKAYAARVGPGAGEVDVKEQARLDRLLNGAKARVAAAKAAASAHDTETAAIRRQLGLADKGIAKGREELAVTRTFTRAVKTLPKGVRTQLEAKILRPKEIVDLVARYKMLDRKKIATLITENGGVATKAKIDRIIAQAKALARVRAEAKLAAKDDATPKIKRAGSELRQFDGKRATAYMTIVRKVTGAAKNAVKNLPFIGGSADGSTVPGRRAPYRDKVLAALAPGEEVISNARGQADRYRPLLKAINADRLAAGGTVGYVQALARGGSARKGKGKGGGKAKALASTAAALSNIGKTNPFPLLVHKGTDALATGLEALQTRVERYYAVRIKNEKAAKAAAAAAQKAVAGEIAALKRNAAARDVVIAKINAAKAAGDAAAEAARQQLDVTSITVPNDAPVTAGFIVQGLEQRVEALDAFRQQLAALRAAGLDRTLVGELAQKGVDQAGAYVSALAKATPEQLRAINTAQAAIRAQAVKIGADTTAGLAVGLASQLRAVDAAGVKLASALIKAMRRRLGIKSPSRAMQSEITAQMVAGAARGFDDSAAAEARAAAMAARVQAAAVPSLGQLGVMAAEASTVTPLLRSEVTVTIRHVITSPDGSVSRMTADQIADIIARDPKAAGVLERALARLRVRSGGNVVSASR